jgi:hypothetical protein
MADGRSSSATFTIAIANFFGMNQTLKNDLNPKNILEQKRLKKWPIQPTKIRDINKKKKKSDEVSQEIKQKELSGSIVIHI